MNKKYYVNKCVWCKSFMEKPWKGCRYTFERVQIQKQGYIGWQTYPMRGKYCDEICEFCDYFNRRVEAAALKKYYEYENQMRKLLSYEKQRSDALDICSIWEGEGKEKMIL